MVNHRPEAAHVFDRLKKLIEGHWLQAGPYQVQILGLYTVLLGFAPLVLWGFSKNRVKLVLALSWILYLKNWAFPSMPTGMQFEYGFPTLTWQLIFFHGMAFGYYRNEITAWFTARRRTGYWRLRTFCSSGSSSLP